MLNVLTLDFNKQQKWFRDPETFTSSDLQAYLESRINVMHPAVGMGGPNAYESALQFFASWNGFIASISDHFTRIDSAADLKRVKKAGKIGVILGLQNSEHFRRPDDVDLFRGLGQRVSQLTYNARNLIGNGFDLTEGLIRRKYNDADIEGILGGNFERVLTQVWT
jgi:membrane dipeptidase